MDFAQLPITRANRLINHGPAILVTASLHGRHNVMTAAWAMPASHTPPMVAVAIGPGRYTHELIMESREFVVNIPNTALLDAVWCCGTTKGRSMDKFAHCNLTPVAGKRVAAPLIKECIGAIECRLASHSTAGDHTIFIGEVLAVWARPDLFDQRLLIEKEEAQTLHHLGGRDFCPPGRVISKAE
ncbi:MAG: flavin reductase family protein [Desulfobulbaceae bacterium]|nr:flavin reductase family protein [Desulfobulbaceae bacterium]